MAEATAEATGPISFNHMGRHGILAEAIHDEAARGDFVQSLQHHVFGHLMPGNKDAYERRVLPAFVRANNRPPANRQEVRVQMRRDPYHQMWGALRRSAQEMMWDAADASISRQDTALRAKSHVSNAKGSLTLDDSVVLPRYLTAVDIHCMPGGYCTEAGDDDVYAGALYDRGVYSLTQGFLGPYSEGFGHTITGYMARNYPDWRPGKILDIGCAVGHGTVPIAQHFADAELHAIDVAAPMLRYAHARAESLGATVHFSQQNAEHLRFDDATFDLVITTATMHELSTSGIRNIMGEIYRVLKPGGLMIHVEQPQYHGMSPYEQFIRDWDTFGNAEPFWGTLHDMDLEQLGVDAGFARANVAQTMEAGEGGRVYNVSKDSGADSDGAEKRGWFFFTGRK
jgi:SAM-dependent methyltransferase